MASQDHGEELPASPSGDLVAEAAELLGISEAKYRRKRLDLEQAWAVIKSAHTGVFTTLRRDGSPIALPVWFVALEREIFIVTPPHSKKVARVRHDSRCSFLVESGKRWVELHAAHVSGTATLLTDTDPRRHKVRRAIDEKYSPFRTSTMQQQAAQLDDNDTAAAAAVVIIRIVPRGPILGWNNGALGLS